MQLFGFLTKDDLKIFKLLIGVSGIGPKGGLSILSQLSPDDLRFAVMANDAKTISSAPGIGKCGGLHGLGAAIRSAAAAASAKDGRGCPAPLPHPARDAKKITHRLCSGLRKPCHSEGTQCPWESLSMRSALRLPRRRCRLAMTGYFAPTRSFGSKSLILPR